MDKKENKGLSILANLDIAVAAVILAVLIVLTFAGVIWRYIFNAPFTWLEEVQTSCMVWIVFAGAGAAFRMGNHVAIEMIVDMMPEKMQKAMGWIISVILRLGLRHFYLFLHRYDRQLFLFDHQGREIRGKGGCESE